MKQAMPTRARTYLARARASYARAIIIATLKTWQAHRFYAYVRKPYIHETPPEFKL